MRRGKRPRHERREEIVPECWQGEREEEVSDVQGPAGEDESHDPTRES